ncbi:unnamed protein product [Rotaria sp. Silwood2]|nr:unnamed protein product [Rotaria sp. Silwood2]
MILHLVSSPPQINLDLTDCVSNSESDATLQHNCLHVTGSIDKETDSRQFISYCMNEYSPKWNIQSNSRERKFTFVELYKHNITSRHLYLWSAPMDVAERYQFYLDQLSISNEASMATQLFYNCTPPRFGPICQYAFDDYRPDHLSLNEIIHDFYLHGYEPTTLTCYVHLQCDRGPAPACLDWSEICDGKVDCLDGGRDEEHCWQLEANECADDQYRCVNGQCIPYTFFRDNTAIPDCLDGSDEYFESKDKRANCKIAESVFECEDLTCTIGHRSWASPLTSSCAQSRSDLLIKAMFLHKPNSVLDECWSAFLCIIHGSNPSDTICGDFCVGQTFNHERKTVRSSYGIKIEF